MISVHSYQPGRNDEIGDPDDISELVGRDDRLLWVDIQDPTDDELAEIQDEFGLNPLAIENVKRHGQRPKIEQYRDHALVVAYSSTLSEVDLFVGPTWLVSIRLHNAADEEWPLDAVRKRFERTCPEQPTSGFLLATILDELVDGYFEATDVADDKLEVLEDRIFAEQLADERSVQEELFDIRRRILMFRRAVVPLRDVLSTLLRKELEYIDDATVVQLQDVYDHVLRAIDLLDSQRELMGNAVDAHLAIISNHMNMVMKKMTSWGAILLVSALVAGIYGMNFQNMPELHWRYGYAYALGLMATITGTGYWYFRRKDWL